MSEQKRYTEQEMREEAEYFDSVANETEEIRKIGLEEGEAIPECFHRTICNMFRQAADTEKENAQLKARLEAVVKVAKEQFEIIYDSPMCWDEDENEFHSLEQLKEMDALEMVVSTARGEGGEK